ncbi:MAG: hypothetical protein LBM65_01005, partial [Oscillospiraceae bacterium]|nr:hypothetical protein [Oscillospiraceae bacterium]
CTFSFTSIPEGETWPEDLDGHWREYRAPVEETTPVVETTPAPTEPEPTEPEPTEPAPTEPEPATITIYFENKYNWTPVAMNYWGDESGTLVLEETSGKAGDGTTKIWKVEISEDLLSKIDGVLFRNNYDTTKWGDYWQSADVAPSKLKDGVCFYFSGTQSLGSYQYK